MKKRPGFTLVELIVAMMLLSVVVLGLLGGIGDMVHSAAENGRETAAKSVLQVRLGQIAADPGYASLEARYQGTQSGNMSGFAWTTTTQITRVRQAQAGGLYVDYKRVTVTVAEAGSARTVTGSITVGAP